MHCFAESFIVMCAVALGDDNRRAGREPGAESDDRVDNRSCGSHRRLRLFSDKLPDHQRIHGIVQLLKQKADRHGNRKTDQMHPDIPFGHVRVSPGHQIASLLP